MCADGAWEEPPPRQMLLHMRDIQTHLQQKWLQLYWPDDSRWWPAQVLEVNPKRNRAHLLYETGLAPAPLVMALSLGDESHARLSVFTQELWWQDPLSSVL